MKSLADRFEAKYIPEPNSGCWLWLGTISKGYGYFFINVSGKKRSVMAHRAAWELLRGSVPPGMQIDHRLCRNKSCVNPDHLVVCTLLENLEQPDASQVIKRMKTHCPKGHAYTPDNTYRQPRGQGSMRSCKICRSARQQSRRHRV